MLQLRLPPELRDRIKTLAESEHRSINGQIVYLLERATQEPGSLLELANEAARLAGRLGRLAAQDDPEWSEVADFVGKGRTPELRREIDQGDER